MKKIKEFVEKIKKDDLVKGSFILLILVNIFNVLGYIFQFSMARLLGPAQYSILAVLMSVIYVFAIPIETLRTTITKYVSRFNVKDEKGKIKDIVLTISKKGFFASIIAFIIYIPIVFVLSYLLEIEAGLFFVIGILIFSFVSISILRGALQGRKKFTLLGTNMVFEGIIKVVLGISLVLIGFQVYGAVTGLVFASVFSLFIGYIFMQDIFKAKRKKAEFKGIGKYSLYMFVAVTAIVLMYSIDTIFAKFFFSDEIAGQYAVVAMLGRIIFFGTIAVSRAMFPFTSENHENGDKTKNLLKKSLGIVAGLCVIALLLYLIFPKLVIGILFGAEYVGVYGILFFVGLALSLLALTNVIIFYGLSTDKIRKNAWFLFIFVAIEAILFSLFHATLVEFSIVFILANVLMLIGAIFLIKPKK